MVEAQKMDCGAASDGRRTLFWIGWRSRGLMLPPTFLLLDMLIVALRIPHWDFGIEQAQRERTKRVETHRRRERAGTHTGSQILLDYSVGVRYNGFRL
jgi:hypothetical protein